MNILYTFIFQTNIHNYSMNKAKFIFTVLSFFIGSHLFSQVVISENADNPDPSAMLEIESHSKGFLMPRLSLSQRSAINNPAEGLMVYCIDCGKNGTPVISVYMTGSWRNLADCAPPENPVAAVQIPNSSKITWKWFQVPGATGYRWSHLPDALEIDLTDTSYIETGLVCGTAYSRYVWAYNDCGLSTSITLNASTNYQPPPAPLAAEHVPELTQIVWKWHHLDDATGYKWNTVLDYQSAITVTGDTTYTESNLACDSLFYRYIWAYNNCGISNVTVINQATLFDTLPVPIEGSHIPTVTQITWNWNNVPGASGYKWNTANNYSTATNLGNQLSKVETELDCQTEYTRYLWAYNNCGYSPVATLNDTTLEIPITESPIEALHNITFTSVLWKWHNLDDTYSYKWSVDNDYSTANDVGSDTSHLETDLTCNTSYIRYVWAYNSCGSSPAGVLSQSTKLDSLQTPAAGTHEAAPYEINWHWNAVTGATGYKWSMNENYENATALGNVLSYPETSLDCGTNYNRYVWAYNDCGYSLVATTLNQSTTNCWVCGDSITIDHQIGEIAPISKTVTYGTINNIPGLTNKCWITNNLGSNHQAASVSDNTEESAGWYWQFNKKQGFKHDGSTRTPNSTWIYPISDDNNWLAQNDPCSIELGSTWRLPTSSELGAIDGAGSWTDWNGPWGSDLKLHAAGKLNYITANLDSRGVQGNYWSSTQNVIESNGQNLFFYSSSCSTTFLSKSYGFTIRCLKD